jgi:hypothetical protein
MVTRTQASSRAQEPLGLMRRRLLRFVVGSALVRGWLQKSPAWFSIAMGIVLFRFVDKRASKAGRVKRGHA